MEYELLAACEEDRLMERDLRKHLHHYGLPVSHRIAGLPGGRLLVASGICMGKSGCDGQVTVARPDKDSGLKKSSSLKR